VTEFVRRAARPLALGLALILLVFAPPLAQAGKAAQAYVQKLADDAMGIINNAALSKEEKKAQLTTLLDANIDVKTIALFTLGQYRKGASDADLDAYIPVFHDYLIGFYIKNLSGLGQASFRITGSTDLAGNKGTVVKSLATGDGGEPMEINWRVLNDASVQDVQIAGAWMALALREQMVTVIDANQGRISAATAKLKEIVAGL